MEAENRRTGELFSSRSWGKEAPVSRRVKRPFLDGEGRPLCVALFGRHSPLLCVSAFFLLIRSRAFSVCSVSHPKPYGLSFRGKSARFFRLLLAGRRCAARYFAFFNDKMLKKTGNMSDGLSSVIFPVSVLYIRGTVAAESAFVSPKRQIIPIKARWGGWGEFEGGRDTSRASSDRMAAAGRARCDEGSYGHRQQR